MLVRFMICGGNPYQKINTHSSLKYENLSCFDVVKGLLFTIKLNSYKIN